MFRLQGVSIRLISKTLKHIKEVYTSYYGFIQYGLKRSVPDMPCEVATPGGIPVVFTVGF
jgi:hypothetical protein